MVRVLIIHASDTPEGGIVNATLFYALALRSCGHEPVLWTASKGLKALGDAAGVETVCDPAIKGGLSIFHPGLIARARRLRPGLGAVVHQGARLFAFGRLWFRGVPEFVVFHNRKIGGRRRFSNWLAISETHYHELKACVAAEGLDRNVGLIRNGPLPRRAETVPPRVRSDITIIGALSNFAPEKDTGLLIRAFAKVADRHKQLRLVLAGDGPDAAPCKALAGELGLADRVSFPGWYEDTRAFFASLDLFCLSSREESFALVAVEAMQASLAVISTDTFGPRDIIIPGETGWLTPVGDVDAYSAAISQALSAPALAYEMGQCGALRVKSLYAPEPAGRILETALGLK